MPIGITHKNKDIMFKVLSQNYKDKSLAVYGLSLPRIKRMLPANQPTVAATEVSADNIFLLEDDSLLILEYESAPVTKDFCKYGKYVLNSLDQLGSGSLKTAKVTVAVIYTGDIQEFASEFDVGALRVQVEQVFLSKFDTDGIYAGLKAKVAAGEALSDDDVMKFIILPLTQPEKPRKQELTERTVDLARQVQDEQQQLFILAGILTATNKFIDREYSEMIKGWIRMTKVARLFEEEKIEAVNNITRLLEKEKVEAVNTAVNTAVIKTLDDERMRIAKVMLAFGDDALKVMQATKLTRAELDKLQASGDKITS